ncbi:MAG: polysaccharide deacetylase family protein [Clostridia bacterium]|nr:polysaccharide deacetylase family protein [Clostridia bacterium]
MKKTLPALLCAVLLLAAVASAGRWNDPEQDPEDAQAAVSETETVSVPATQAAKAAAAQTAAGTEFTTGARGTFTDRFPLPQVHFTVSDPDNTRGLSTLRIDHSFGVAKNEQPHEISVTRQAELRRAGSKAVVYDDRTREKALYLTFDCGFENGNTAQILDVLQKRSVPAAFFCTLYHIRQQPQLIARMIAEGHIVGNHSDSHPDFSSISRSQMARELEAVENALRTDFGYTSRYFRFPEGAYSENALDLVESLGYTPVFWSSAYADWDTENPKGADFALQTVTSRLHPGAVILLHAVSPDNAAAMEDIIDTARAMGYTFRALTDLGK